MFFGHDGLDYTKTFSEYYGDWIEREKNGDLVVSGRKGFRRLFAFRRVYEFAKMFSLPTKECLEVLKETKEKPYHHFQYTNPHESIYLLRRHVGDLIEHSVT